MALTTTAGGGFIATGEHVKLVQMRAQLGALRLEALGMKRSGPSVYSLVKRAYNLKGTRQEVAAGLEERFKVEAARLQGEERTRIGNTPTCDECGEQHSQDLTCEEAVER